MPLGLQLPRLYRRIAALLWARRLLWLLIPVSIWLLVRDAQCIGCAVADVYFGLLLLKALAAWEESLRRQFIRDAALPRFLVGKVCAAHPGLKPRDAELVLRGLRQFFLAHLRSGRQFVAMPSRVVDTAWHEFILHTQAYQAWCRTAFGALLHHTPAEVLGRDARRNDGLRRTWYWACKEESIDPRQPARLPLLFALDGKFDIPGGFRYVPDCRAVAHSAHRDAHCGTSFGESADGSGSDSGPGAGDAAGFGGSESGASADGGGTSDGGSSCGGGGCGGGGGD